MKTCELTTRDAFDILLHAGCAGLLHLHRDMTVNVQRERCSSMAQIALYGFDIITGTNGGNGVRMPQIMEPGIGAANGGGKLLAFPIDCRLGQRAA